MKRLCFQTIFLLLALALAAAAWAAEAPIPPAPKQWVTDTAGFLSPRTAQSLNARLRDYQQATGHQVVVWIGRSTGDTPLEEWVVKAFEKWQVGRKGVDDGVLLAIMADDRKMRFEVGYGMEGEVPDVLAWRIISEVMTPRLKAGDRDGAVTAGIDALLEKIGGEKPGAAGREAGRTDRGVQPRDDRPSLGQMIFYAIVGIVFLFILITNPSLALYLLMALGSGGRGGGGYHGGGRGGGGFSGGGGRSGGGGASGGW